MAKRKLALVLGTMLASSLALAGCSGSSTPAGPDGSSLGARPGEDNCIPIVVATSSEKINLMDDLGQKFRDSPEYKTLPAGKCATVFPLNYASGAAAQILAESSSTWPLDDTAYWPTMWSPASTVWTDRVAAAGNSKLVAGATSFAKTPVVFGMPESMTKALGYPKKPISITDLEKLIASPEGWAAYGKPLWGQFKIAKTNPETSTTGLNTILMQTYEAAGKAKGLTVNDVASAKEFSRQFELGAIHYGDSTGKVLTRIASQDSDGYVSAIALEETSIYNYNLGNPDSHTLQPGEQLVPPAEKLVAVYPSGGSLWSDNPAVVLSASWVTPEQTTAANAFMKFLQSKTAQETLPEYGFRPVAENVDVAKYLNASVGIDPTQPKVTLPKPDPTVVSAAIDQWLEIRKPSAVLELVDLSGSMDDPAGNGRSKLQGAIQGAESTIDHFRSTDEVGLWGFSTGLPGNKQTIELRKFAPIAGDLEKLKDEITSLRTVAGTPLYDAIAEAYDYMNARAEAGRINAIVVLSDGQDTDSRTSLSSLLVKLNSDAQKEGSDLKQVRIFTIAYGEGADKDILSKISEATGGQMFDATDATKIETVFAQVVNNF